ncbi:hypothetical protein QZH41_017685, partial [Actinostola sp. cb2023]
MRLPLKYIVCSLPSNNVVSNVIRLKRFYSSAPHPFDVLGSEMCQLLLKQPDNMMSFIDLKKHYDQ